MLGLPSLERIEIKKQVLFEHIQVTKDKLEVLGEHIMTAGEPLQLLNWFWGADRTLTNYRPGRTQWAATLIFCGRDWSEVTAKRLETIKSIRRHFHLRSYADLNPGEE